MGKAIGIDLGTTYSCVGVWQNGRVEIIANDQGNRTTPSCVAFTDSERFIGDAAVNQAPTNPTNTIFDAKRLIGRKINDTTVQSDIKLWPFKVIAGEDKRPVIQVNYMGKVKTLSAEEISSMVILTMKQTAAGLELHPHILGPIDVIFVRLLSEFISGKLETDQFNQIMYKGLYEYAY